MPRQMKKSSKRFEKSVKAIVREELQEELEDKVAVIGQDMFNIDTAGIPTGNVATSSNVIKLMPFINQGLNQYNSRIGNEIRLKHLDLKMIIAYDALQSRISADNPTDQSIGVRVMILRQKDENSANGLVENFQGNKLLENGGISVAGPASFTGQTFNLIQKINREQFSVRYDKTFYMDAPFSNKPVTAPNVPAEASQPVLPPKVRTMQHRLKFGKNGLKLTFGDQLSESPTNFPYVMVIGYASTCSSVAPSNNLVRVSYTSNAAYTDA